MYQLALEIGLDSISVDSKVQYFATKQVFVLISNSLTNSFQKLKWHQLLEISTYFLAYHQTILVFRTYNHT